MFSQCFIHVSSGFSSQFSPIISTSALHSICEATISIWHCGGSSGNSAICRPRGVNAPVWSNAPKIHNWYKEFRMLSCGGGSMKWNWSKSATPKLLSSSTVLAKFVRWISGTVRANKSSLYCRSVYNRNACPGPVRPARPERWLAFACDIG